MHSSTVLSRIRIVAAVVVIVAVCAICPTAYGEVINVLDYGAIGNGIADDTAALQSAINLGRSTHRPVYIPFGTYRVTQPIDASIGGYDYEPLVITSDWATLLADAPMESVLKVNMAAYLSLERLRIDANNLATYGAKFYKISGVRNQIQQLEVTRALSHGFYFDKCQVAVFDGLDAESNGGDGFYVRDSNGAVFRDSQARWNGGNGFTLTALDFSGGASIRGGSIEGNGGHGIDVVNTTSPVLLTDIWLESNTGDGVRIGTRDVGVNGLSIVGYGLGDNYAIHLVPGAKGAYVTGNYVQRSGGSTNYASIHLDPGVSSSNIGFANFNRYSGSSLPTFGYLQLPDQTATFSHIEGNATFAADNILAMELGGTTAGSEYDTLLVDGTLTLNGTLDVILIDGFEPSVGDSFDILDFGSLAGQFTGIDLPILTDELVWNLSELYSAGEISVVPTALGGDFDLDGDVSGVDFLYWQIGYPTASGATLSDGDADGDGDVDGADFGIWQANFPFNVGSAAAIPEPATLFVMLAAGLGLLLRSRSRLDREG